jgi:hypothetical protein
MGLCMSPSAERVDGDDAEPLTLVRALLVVFGW